MPTSWGQWQPEREKNPFRSIDFVFPTLISVYTQAHLIILSIEKLKISKYYISSEFIFKNLNFYTRKQEKLAKRLNYTIYFLNVVMYI